jgi:hypothetical protein
MRVEMAQMCADAINAGLEAATTARKIHDDITQRGQVDVLMLDRLRLNAAAITRAADRLDGTLAGIASAKESKPNG